MKLYRIKDWATAYETHETRKYVALKWVPLPNKHDGLTFRKIGLEKNASDLFTAWVLMVQIASKSSRERRGELIRDNFPMTARDMALVTGFPENIFNAALKYFAQPSVNWIEIVDTQSCLPLSPATPEDSPASPVSSAENPPDERKERIEQNRIEGTEGNEQKDIVASLPFGSVEFSAAWSDFRQHRSEIKKKLTPTATKQIFAKLTLWGEQRALAAIRHTIEKGWQGIFEPNERTGRGSAVLEPRFNKF